jgi:acyl-coenzyme A thioesterase PaaI-like protein
VRARCTFTAAHGGSPSRVHGGVVAAALDEVVGVAAAAAGASGMTVALDVTLRAGTPFGVPVDIVGRYVRSDGRKRFASGDVLVDGTVTAHADLICVSERREPGIPASSERGPSGPARSAESGQVSERREPGTET